MEKSNVIESELSKEKVDQYRGKIVSVKYFNENRGESVIEQVVIGGLNQTHLRVISVFDSSFIEMDLGIPKVECFFSELNNELVVNSGYEKEYSFVVKK